MNLAISPDVENLLRARAEAEGITVEQYVERMARDEQQGEEELEALALEGLNSGESIVVDDEFWERKRQQLLAQFLRKS